MQRLRRVIFVAGLQRLLSQSSGGAIYEIAIQSQLYFQFNHKDVAPTELPDTVERIFYSDIAPMALSSH